MGLIIIAGIITLVLAIGAGIAVGAFGASEPFEGFLAFVVVFVVAGAVLIGPAYSWDKAHYNDRHVICTIDRMDRTEDDMRVYTKDCGVFVNADSWFRGKTTSGDLWGTMHDGGRYDFHVAGWRNGVISDFPNILDVKQVNQ